MVSRHVLHRRKRFASKAIYACLMLCLFTTALSAQERFRANSAGGVSHPTEPIIQETPKEQSLGAREAVTDSESQKPFVNGETSVSKSKVEPTKLADDSFEKRFLSQPGGSANASGINKKADIGSGSSLGRVVISLLVVLALIVGAAYYFRFFNPAKRRLSKMGGLEVVAKNNINPKQSLCLVKVGSRLVLLGLSPNHIAALDVIDNPEEVSRIRGSVEGGGSQSVTGAFGNLFHRESRHYEDDEDMDNPREGDADREVENESFFQAQSELTGLLDKIKGLVRLRSRS